MTGSFYLTIMLVLQMISTIFLLKKHPNFYFYSWIIFLLSSVFLLIGLFRDVTNIYIGNYSGFLVGILILLPMLANLIYLILNVGPTNSIERTGLPKLLIDTWGSNRTLLSDISQIYNLKYVANSGEEEACAEGVINKYNISIKTDQWYQYKGRAMAGFRFMKITTSVASYDVPDFLIVNTRSVLSIPQLTTYKVKEFTRLNNLYVYTNKSNREEVIEKLNDSKDILSKILKGSAQRFIRSTNGELQFAKKYGLFSVDLSEQELKDIISNFIILAIKLE